MRGEDAKLGGLVERLTGRRPPKKRSRPLVVRRILLGLEPAHPSPEAVAWAADLARRFDAYVHVVSVVSSRKRLTPFAEDAGTLILEEEEAARRVVIDALKTLDKAKVKAGFRLMYGTPAVQLLKAADGQGIDLIIVGSHGLSPVGRLLLGSTADDLKNHSECSILITRKPPPARNVVLAIDGSRLSRRAAGFGLRLARQCKTVAHLVHVVAMSPYASKPILQDAVAERIRELDLFQWKRPGLLIDVVVGREANGLLRKARRVDSNLIVMGSRGWGGLRSLVAGGVSNAVSHSSPTSVLLVKEARR